MELTPRLQNIISGLIALVLVFGAITLGVARSFGVFDDVYTVTASFDAAGQGLIKDSDVKVRGVNIGEVESVTLDDGRAKVKMRINDGNEIPEGVVAIVRAKTLFGEKFIDLDYGAVDASTTYLPTDGSAQIPAEQTLGGFELEEVLTDTYPILEAIDPADLAVIVSEFADAGAGLGPAINRTIVNGAEVLEVFARHDADTQQFLRDFAVVAETLAAHADELVAGGQDLNVALPVLASNGPELNVLLTQTARLSGDVADLLIDNRTFVDTNFTLGQQSIDILYDRRFDVVPLVVGLRNYLETLVSIARFPIPGTDYMMGAVKGLIANACDFVPCSGPPPVAVAAPAGPIPAGDEAAAAPVEAVSPGPVTALLRYLAGLSAPSRVGG